MKKNGKSEKNLRINQKKYSKQNENKNYQIMIERMYEGNQ